MEKVYPDLLIATAGWLSQHRGSVPEQVSIAEAGREDLREISSLTTPPEVLALVKKRETVLSAVNTKHQWILALDGIRDPGNFGSIVRTADWFGIKHVVCSEDCVELYNPKTIQSTMGAIFRVQVHYTNLAEWLGSLQIPVIAATLQGTPVHEIKFPDAGVLVIGSESHGIHAEVQKRCSDSVFIPAYGRSESLNASVAAGILLYAVTAK